MCNHVVVTSIEVAHMLTLTAARDAIDELALATAGGFGWWYADIVDDKGNGIVVIAGEGLPFLPGIASAARAGQPVLPKSRPSLMVAVYEQGICTFYGLRELLGRTDLPARLQGARVDLNDGLEEVVVFGDSTLRFCHDDVVSRLIVDVDLDVGVGHLTGTITVTGPQRQHDAALHTLGTPAASFADVVHRWAPQLGPARGEARLSIDGRDVVIVGSGYHDRNSARRPLHELGIAWWVWGRAEVVVEGRAQLRIVYACWPDGRADGDAPEAFGVVIDDVGVTTVVAVDVEVRLSRSWLRMRDVRTLRARTADGVSFLVGEVVARVDDGPFYLRSTWRADVDAAPAATTGYLEVVEPHAVDIGWQRPFVQMKVTPPSLSLSSVWQPLFAGARAGRVSRQVRRFLGRA